MGKLEKILDEIEEREKLWKETQQKTMGNEIGINLAIGYRIDEIEEIKNIICNHMDHASDGWIPVKKEWPPFGQRLQATILHHEWVSDYDSAWVPEEEKIHHAAYTEVCEIYPSGAMWCYNCAEDDYHSDVAYIEPAKDMNMPVAEIIAWRPLPELYRPEGSV